MWADVIDVLSMDRDAFAIKETLGSGNIAVPRTPE
jgi:hypothetical protein